MQKGNHAGEIHEYSNISFDTVNRTLMTFTGIGIDDVAEIFGGAKRFDPNVKNHHHLHCTQCNKIFDFYDPGYDNLEVSEDVSEQFRIISKRVVLKGACKACRKQNHLLLENRTCVVHRSHLN